MDHLGGIFREYAAWLKVDLCFQGFEDELRTLPGAYARPRGRLLLARDGAEIAGAVALRPLEGDVCEMKRLYVRPAWRGRGLGRRLAAAVIAQGRDAGYARMRLDTLAFMAEATRLYRSLGFSEIPAYYHNPLEGVLYLERRLDGQ
jgi:carbonic anhydrase